ncbi:MAG TPA: hypothetical protein VGL09_15475 [Methylomirabilota bacterium]|jgi:type II secretory pathway predicted ATPase ExeA
MSTVAPLPSVDETVVATADPGPFDDPSPRRPWLGKLHRDALTALLAGASAHEPILLLTGDAGSGKTVVAGVFLDVVAAGGGVVAAVNGAGDLATIEGLRDVVAAGRVDGVPVVLAVDDAHALTPEAFQVLVALVGPPPSATRGRRGDVTVLLAGDYGLYSVLREADGRLLAAIRTTVHLRALSADEVADYIGERLRDATVAEQNFFTSAALQAIAAWSGGLPGAVNALCASALDEVSRRRPLLTESTVIAECARNLGWSADEEDLAATIAIETANQNASASGARRFVPGPRTVKVAALIAGVALVAAGSLYSARRGDGPRPLVERAAVVGEPLPIPVSKSEVPTPSPAKRPLPAPVAPPVAVTSPAPLPGAGAGSDAQKARSAAGVVATESLSASPVLATPPAARAKPPADVESRPPERAAPRASTAAAKATPEAGPKADTSTSPTRDPGVQSAAAPKAAATSQAAATPKAGAASAPAAPAAKPAAAPARNESARDPVDDGAIIDWLLKEYTPPR